MTLPLLSFDITSTMIKKGVAHFVNKMEGGAKQTEMKVRK
jgi:hypothetical protein